MDPVRQLAKLLERLLQLALGLGEQLLGIRVDVGAQELQAHPQGQEALLRAVVEIGLESASLVVAGADDAGARLLKLDQLGAELGVQPCVLQRQACSGPGRLQQRGLVDEVSLVDDHGQPLADVRGVPALFGRQVERLAALVHPGAAVGNQSPTSSVGSPTARARASRTSPSWIRLS